MITGCPSLNQEMVGVGSPSALQPKVTGSFLATAVSSGCSMILGAEDEATRPKKQRVLSLLNVTPLESPRKKRGKSFRPNLNKLRGLVAFSAHLNKQPF